MQDENNVVYKTLNNTLSLNNCFIRENTSVIEPSITIETTTNISDYNYCYIPDFRRYYYIKNISSVRKNLWQVDLKCDVLMSYKNSFNKFDIIGGRTQESINRYLNDSENKVLAKQEVFCTKFPNTPFSKDMNFILTTVGVSNDDI